MKRKLLYMFLLLLCMQGVKAQCGSPYDAQTTYWHYRYRLINYFMQIGMGNSPGNPQYGQSIPAYVRNWDNNNYGCGGTIWWSDQGRNLGYYIGTLATEYYLLTKNGQNTNETVMELFFALHAIFRLDSLGIENWIQTNGCGSLNNNIIYGGCSLPTFPGSGYMENDDVSSSFYNNVNPTVPTLSAYGGYGQVGSGIVGPINAVSAWGGVPGHNNSAGSGMSQDNYYAILMGLSLTSQLLQNFPPITTYYDAAQNPHNFSTKYGDLATMSNKLASVILSYIYRCNDQLTDPGGTTVGLGAGQQYAYCEPLNDIGQLGSLFSYMNQGGVSCAISNTFLWDNYTICNLVFTTWNTCPPSASNVEMGCELAAMSNNGYGVTGNAQAVIEGLGNYPQTTCYQIPPPAYCTFDANQYGENLLFEAVNQILYPSNNNFTQYISLCDMENIINGAPWDGPYRHENNDYAGCGWGADNRFIWGPPYPSGGPGWAGNFNGLDYMFFYNLYCLMSEWQNSYMGPNTVLTGNFPGAIPGNSPTNPLTFVTPHCLPIYVTQVNVANNGGFAIQGGSNSFIDITPSSGNVVVNAGGYFEASCPQTCCQSLYDGYVYQFDPGVAGGADRAPELAERTDSINYAVSSEFAPKPNYDAIIAYPNPFIARTAFEFAIKETTLVTISIFNTDGGKIEDVFVNKTYNQGNYVQDFDGSTLSSGIYICVMTTKDDRKTIKIVKN